MPDPESVSILLKAGADTRQKLFHTTEKNGKKQTREGNLYQVALGMYQTKKHTRYGPSYIRIVNEMTQHHFFTADEKKRMDQYRAKQEAQRTKQEQADAENLKRKYSPFYEAIKKGDLPTVKRFFENKKIAVNFAELESGYPTPLMAAVSAQKIDITKYLLKKGADVSIADSDGDDALNKACAKGNVEIAKLLVAHGANYKSNVNTEGENSLYAAVRSGNQRLVTYLLEIGAPVNPSGEYIRPPVHAAALTGNIGMVKLLISKGADIQALDKQRGTIVHAAVLSKNLEMVKYLVNAGLDLNTPDAYGRSPLDLASKAYNQDIAAYLKERGARSLKTSGQK